MDKTKLTAKALSTFSNTTKEREKIWDTELKGFHALRLKSSISFRLFYRNAEGKQRTTTLGQYPALTADQARKLAKEALGRIASGEDIQETKLAARREAESRHHQTLGAYLDGPYTAYQNRKKSGDQTLATIRKHYKSWLNRPLDSITPKDISRWQAEKEAEKLHYQTIKRTYGALKTCLNQALKAGIIESHQLEKCQLEKPHLTESDLALSGTSRRFLSEDETAAFFHGIEAYHKEKQQQRRNSRAHGKAWLPCLDDVPYTDHVSPWLLTMFYTGFRPGDLFGLRWEHVNLHFRTIRKTIEKTAHHQPEPRTFPISKPLVEVLQQWSEQNGKPTAGHVFPSERTGKRMDKKSMQKPWRKIKEYGGITVDMDLYTLRHNFASQLIFSGADLLTVSKLMAHTDIQTTIKHYGHLQPDLARNCVDNFAEQHTPK